MKDDFLAVLSHELRTPLSALLGYSRLIRGGLLDAAKTREALEVVERNARSLTQIVEDVLDVSRIVAGKIRGGARASARRSGCAARRARGAGGHPRHGDRR
jgi:signal transduction histidine kinase